MSTSSFDLEAHVIQRYSGEALIQRLLWIAEHSTPNNQAALRAALTVIMKQNNVIRYKEIHSHSILRSALGNNSSSNNNNSSALDTHWLQEAEAVNRHQVGVLQSRLQTAQAHLHKEAVRTAYTALAQFHWSVGDLPEAFHAAVRAKDYCTTRNQTSQTSLLILALALHSKNYAAVRDYVPRVEHTVGMITNSSSKSGSANTSTSNANNSSNGGGGGSSSSSAEALAVAIVKNRVQTASGLERLAAGALTQAAQKLSAVALNSTLDSSSSSEGGHSESGGSNEGSSGKEDWESTVLAPEDVCVYAAVLTLSHGDRTAALHLAEHPEALERVPILREVLVQFYKRASYKTAWELLETHVWPLLQNDLYFQQPYYNFENSTSISMGVAPLTILDAVQQSIRHKAIGQFWKPYHNCPLATMAEQLGQGLAGPNLEETVIQLLKNNRRGGADSFVLPTDTRLDWRTHTLVRERPDSEADRLLATTQKMETTSTRVLNDTYAMVIRLACIEHDLVIQDPSGGKRGRGRGGGWGGRKAAAAAAGAAAAAAAGGFEVGGSSDDEDDGDAHMVDAIQMGDGMNPEDLY